MWLDRRPTHVPEGYRLRSTIVGGHEPGLGEISEQVALIYTRGWSLSDWSGPLTVYLGSVGAPELVATNPHHGAPLDVGIDGVSAVYHDGIQTMRSDGFGHFAGLDWATGTAHSITARCSSGTVAVRGPRALPMFELVTVVASVITQG
jgi:hypothetical protein